MRTETIRNLTASGIIAAVLVGCSSSSTGPDGPAPAPTSWNLSLDVQDIYVSGDCENAAGNPGEFAYEVNVSIPARASATHATPGFPSNSGVRTMHEDQTYAVGRTLEINGVADDQRHNALLKFSVIEFDGDERDNRMNYEQETVPMPFRTATAPERRTSINVGPVFGCRLTLYTLPTWTPAN